MAKKTKETRKSAATEPVQSTATKEAAAQWIREAIKKHGPSQKEFAAKIGVHFVTVSNWARQKFMPDWESTQKIRDLFPDLPPAPGVVPPAVLARVAEVGRPKTVEGAEIAGLIDSMTPELRAEAREAVYAIVRRVLSRPQPPPPLPDGHDRRV